MQEIELEAIDESAVVQFSQLKTKHSLSKSDCSCPASESLHRLKQTFGQLLRWTHFVYNHCIKSQEILNLERYLAKTSSKRNSTLQLLERWKSSLRRVGTKLENLAQIQEEISRKLQAVLRVADC